LYDLCQANEYCKAGSYYCLADVCTANAATCNGGNLSTCAADGSGPVDAGASCGAGKTCFGGACKAVVCTPDALQCSGGNIQRCTDNGTAWIAYQTCGGATFCNELATPITCSPATCAPGSNACNGEKLATCAADGGHFTATGTNCAASNTVCTLAGTCAAVAQDTIAGPTPEAFGSSVLGNVYRVDRARTLTKIEQYLSVSGTSAFTWVVYESPTEGGTFTKIYEGTTSDSGTGAFFSSGAISVPLAAGKFYMLGVAVLGNFTDYVDQSNSQAFVSFGQVTRSVYLYTSVPPASWNNATAYRINNQRISTTH